jgi:hypothetical protein
MNADEYKEKHGLNRNRGLVSQSTHNISSQWAYNRIVNGEIKPFDNDTVKRANLKGITRREELKQHLKKVMTGRKLSDEHKANISKSATGRILDEETRRKISNFHKGKSFNKGIPKSDECRRKMSEARKGRVPWNKGKKWPESIKEKIRKSHIARLQKPCSP